MWHRNVRGMGRRGKTYTASPEGGIDSFVPKDSGQHYFYKTLASFSTYPMSALSGDFRVIPHSNRDGTHTASLSQQSFVYSQECLEAIR